MKSYFKKPLSFMMAGFLAMSSISGAFAAELSNSVSAPSQGSVSKLPEEPSVPGDSQQTEEVMKPSQPETQQPDGAGTAAPQEDQQEAEKPAAPQENQQEAEKPAAPQENQQEAEKPAAPQEEQQEAEKPAVPQDQATEETAPQPSEGQHVIENPLKIAFVDAGRKYFSVQSLKDFIDNAALGNFNAVEIGFGNDGLRFLLDDMTIKVGDHTYSDEEVRNAILEGNTHYYDDPNGNALTEREMDEIIGYAHTHGIEIIPLLDTPGHMDAIVYAIKKLGFTDATYDPTEKYPGPTQQYPYDEFVPSERTINLDNEEVVAFTKALVQKYVDYFQKQDSKYFNLGADEFANDIRNEMGIEVLTRDPKDYAKLVKYINDVADMIKKGGMRPMAFNDCMYYHDNKDVEFNKDIMVSYWSNGWWHYYLAKPQTFVDKGHELINLNGAYYWILGEGKDKCSPEKAAGFDIFAFNAKENPAPAGVTGAMFAIWCDVPSEMSDQETIDRAAATIQAFGKALPETENHPILADTKKLQQKLEQVRNIRTDAFTYETADILYAEIEAAERMIDAVEGLAPISQKMVDRMIAALDEAVLGLRKEESLKITFVDAGRKYFSVSSLKKIIDSAAQGGFNAVEIGFGNDGLRFLLDDMTIKAGDHTYSDKEVRNAILEGNTHYYDDPNGNALTEREMDEIIGYAHTRGIEIIPLLDTPGHMDAIVYAIKKLGFTNATYDPTKKYPGPTQQYPYDKFIPSERTINLDNEEVVAFTKALVQKYVDYFQKQGSKYFNLGADEFANDITNEMGIEVLTRDPKDYAKLVKYINDVADMIKKGGMRPMAFNDCMYYHDNKTVAFDKDIMVSYWSNGWWHYYLAKPQTFVDKGHELINLNGAYYWILGEGKDKCSPEKAAGFNINKFNAGENPDPNGVAGAMFAIWCDVPGEMSDADVAERTADTIRAFGRSLQVSTGGSSGGHHHGGGNSGNSGNSADKDTDKDADKNTNGDKVTTEKKPDGTVVETTITADGDKTVTETKPDGAVITTYETSAGVKGTVHTNSSGTITEIAVKVSPKAVEAANNGSVKLPVQAVSTANKSEAASIRVEVPAGGTKVELPVEKLTAGTVAILVHEDGSEEIIKRTAMTKDGIMLDLAATSTFKLIDNSKSFQDIAGDGWYKNAVDFVSSRELMQGTMEDSFSPAQPLSRSMLAVILYNLENQPQVEQNNSFADVPADSWFSKAILWATEKNILSGYGNGKVGPNDKITREQLAAMLYRYAGSPATNGQLTGFTDADKTSQFAQTAMVWATETGIISGRGNGELAPRGQATRAEVAQMIMNFLN